MKTLKPGFVSIENVKHPEWGTFGIRADKGDYYEIYNSRGSRILFKDEAIREWRLA